MAGKMQKIMFGLLVSRSFKHRFLKESRGAKGNMRGKMPRIVEFLAIFG